MHNKSKRADLAKAPAASREEASLRLTLAVVTASLNIYRAGAVVDAILEARHSLDARRYSVLRLIRDGQRYPSRIAEAMHLPRSVITRTLHALADARYIVRAFDRDDSRRTRLALTPEGEAVFEAATRSLRDWIAPKFEGFTEAEIAVFFRTVAVLTTEDPPKDAA